MKSFDPTPRIRVVALAAMISMAWAVGCGPGDPVAFPDASVLLVSVDTLRADHLGCYGYERATSPALDAIAADAIVFENVVAQSTWTTPSHAALMTSRYPTELGLETWPNPGRIPDRTPTLAEVLLDAGLRTRAVTESGWMAGKFGFARGFETYDDRGGHFRKIVPRVEMLLPEIVGERFFLFLHTYDVHWYAPPPDLEREFTNGYTGQLRPSAELRKNVQMHDNREWVERLTPEDRRYIADLYDAEIRNVDRYLVRLVEELRRLDVWDRMIFVLTSDHGEEFFERGRSGHGYSAHDEQVRVPLIVRLPGGAHGGTRISAQVRSIDVMPTLLDLLGTAGPRPEMRGESLVALLQGVSDMRPAFVDRGHVPEVAVRVGGWKVIRNVRSGKDRVYDLVNDPGERFDRSGDSPPEGDQARRNLEGWLEEVVPPKERTRAAPLTAEELERIRELGYIDDTDETGKRESPPPKRDAGSDPSKEESR